MTGADGVPKSVRVSWRAPCKQPGYRATGGTRFTAPYTSVSADVVTDTNKTYRVKVKGGLRGRITTNLVVNRSGDRWVGTLGGPRAVRPQGPCDRRLRGQADPLHAELA